MDPASPLAVIVSLLPACRDGVAHALDALEAERVESRRLVASIEELETLRLHAAARESLRDARAALLAWLGEARRCAAAWRRHRDLLEAVEGRLVGTGDEVALIGEGEQTLARLGASGLASHDAAVALDERARLLRIAEVRLGLRAAIADPATADATMGAVHAALHRG